MLHVILNRTKNHQKTFCSNFWGVRGFFPCKKDKWTFLEWTKVEKKCELCVIKKCEVCVFKKHQHQWTIELLLLVLYYFIMIVFIDFIPCL